MNKQEIMNLLKSIKYGWLDKNGKINIDNYDKFSSDYILQTPNEVLSNKVGVCWDQVELLRNYFEKINKKVKTYFLIYKDGICPTHTFLTYEVEGKYYWVEHAWEMFSGIHEYNNRKELLLDVKNKYIDNELNDDFKANLISIYEYKKPKFHISVDEFVSYCCSGKEELFDD